MKERPILFSGEMVRAILDGRKTQTRRIVKAVGPDNWLKGASNHVVHALDHCPYGQPGDRLWVRETWSTCPMYDKQKPSEMGPEYFGTIRYKASGERSGKLRPSIFMPRWASRITLEIKDVRVERLNSISEEDAKAEGAPDYQEGINAPPPEDGDYQWCYAASFRNLWQSINGAESWQANSWVWVIEFSRVES